MSLPGMDERLEFILDELEDLLEGAENAADDGQPGFRAVQHKIEEALGPLRSATISAQRACNSVGAE